MTYRDHGSCHGPYTDLESFIIDLCPFVRVYPFSEVYTGLFHDTLTPLLVK